MKALFVIGLIVAPNSVVISNDHGGNLASYEIQAREFEWTKTWVEVAGFCDSACTLFLRHHEVCIHPGASFGFHRATNTNGTAHLLRQYPEWVRQWIADQGGLSSAIKRMNFEYASQFVPTCERRQAAIEHPSN